MADSENYYVRRQGRVDGPWNVDKLRSEIKLRKLGRHHEVSLDGTQWQRAQDINGLFSAASLRKSVKGLSSSTPELELEVDENYVFSTELSDDSNGWYCSIADQQRGPMSRSDLIAILTGGQATLDDLVWREGFSGWMPVESVPELMTVLDSSSRVGTVPLADATQMISKKARTSWLAILSLAAGIAIFLLSWLPVVGLLGFIPVVTSSIAIYRVRASNGTLTGIGLAIAGLVLGMLSLAVGIIVLLGFAAWLNSM